MSRLLAAAEQAARAHGSLPALSGPGESYTFVELHEALLAAIPERRVSGRRLMVRAPGAPGELIELFGLVAGGATVVLIGPREPASAVRELRARFGLEPPPVEGGSPQPQPQPQPPRDGRLVLLTSGSTGQPKAVLHSPSSLLASAQGAVEHLDFGPGGRWAIALPTNHAGGLAIPFRALVSGGEAFWPNDARALADVARSSTHLSLVPTQLRRLVQTGTPVPVQMQRVLLGGASVPPSLTNQASQAGWPLVLSYGLTETGSLVTATDPGDLQSSGRVLPERGLRISQTGEIEVGGQVLFEGYLEGELSGEWHRTGDLGRVDEEGRLHVLGRIDNMFVSGGENVHPETIESALMALPGVEEAVVVGVPDEEFGSRPIAFVRGPSRPEALEEGLRKRLPGFLVPAEFRALPPHGPDSIKPSRAALRDLAIRGRP